MSRTFRKILPILGVVFALGATSAFAQSDLPADMRTAIDAAANAALKESGAPGASIAVVRDGKLAYVQAYGDAKRRSESAGAAGDALQHRVDQQAVHGDGDPDARRGREAVARRSGRRAFLPDLTRANEVTIRQLLSHTSGYQDYWPQDYVPPFMLQDGHRGADPRQVGEEAARLRARDAMAVQQHRLRHRGRDRREGEREAAARSFSARASSRRSGWRASWTSTGRRSGRTIRPATCATPSDRCASRRRRARAGSSPRASSR